MAQISTYKWLKTKENRSCVTARFSELLASGLDELMVNLLPIKDTDDELLRLVHSIAEL